MQLRAVGGVGCSLVENRNFSPSRLKEERWPVVDTILTGVVARKMCL